tara:strand:+ start:2721 stop:4820 length:2100 start_codon:yes stop_codon:yes gene_type:complete
LIRRCVGFLAFAAFIFFSGPSLSVGTDGDDVGDSHEVLDGTNPRNNLDCLVCDITISGIVYHWKNHSLIQAVTVVPEGVSGSGSNNVFRAPVTGTNGRYDVELRANGPDRLVATKKFFLNEAAGAISSADALAALKISVGVNPNIDSDGDGPLDALPISPYQFIAADVNRDGRVTSADALEILKMSVMASDAEESQWVFASEDYDFWDETSHEFYTTKSDVMWRSTEISIESEQKPVQNLVGILMGDVDGSWSAPEQSLNVTNEHFRELVELNSGSLSQWGLSNLNLDGGDNTSDNTFQMVQVSWKRGLGYGHLTEEDLRVMAGKVKWWYNWGKEAKEPVQSVYADYGYDFVPMAWGARFDETVIRKFVEDHPTVRYLLGFNEPGHKNQANLTPAQAAEQWPRLQSIADDYDLVLVSPGVNYAPGDVDIPGTENDGSPLEYLRAFFKECNGCRVDHIAIHGYMRNASNFKEYVKKFEEFNKPIWVTEWASMGDWAVQSGRNHPGLEWQMDYLAETTRWLEQTKSVHRYAWFVGRSRYGLNEPPYNSILAEDGVLSPLGGLYAAIPSTDYRYPIPTKIEAEGAHDLSGFSHQPTNDVDGLTNLVATPGGEAMFKISSEASVECVFDLRLASEKLGRALIQLDGELAHHIPDVNTGSNDAWLTFRSDPVTISVGEHDLLIRSEGEFRFNWLRISECLATEV